VRKWVVSQEGEGVSSFASTSRRAPRSRRRIRPEDILHASLSEEARQHSVAYVSRDGASCQSGRVFTSPGCAAAEFEYSLGIKGNRRCKPRQRDGRGARNHRRIGEWHALELDRDRAFLTPNGDLDRIGIRRG